MKKPEFHCERHLTINLYPFVTSLQLPRSLSSYPGTFLTTPAPRKVFQEGPSFLAHKKTYSAISGHEIKVWNFIFPKYGTPKKFKAG